VSTESAGPGPIPENTLVQDKPKDLLPKFEREIFGPLQAQAKTLARIDLGEEPR
jgi:hypothetical protein